MKRTKIFRAWQLILISEDHMPNLCDLRFFQEFLLSRIQTDWKFGEHGYRRKSPAFCIRGSSPNWPFSVPRREVSTIPQSCSEPLPGIDPGCADRSGGFEEIWSDRTRQDKSVFGWLRAEELRVVEGSVRWQITAGTRVS